jgi:CysZ protein
MTTPRPRCPICGDPIAGDAPCARCATATPARARALGFLGGVSALIRGVGYLFARPRLWPLAVAPVAMTLILFVGVIIGATIWVNHLIGGESAAFLYLTATLITLIVLAIAFFTFTVVGTALASPFLDLLGARVETALLPSGRGVQSSFVRDTIRSVGDTIRVLVLQIVVLLVSLPLNLIPVVGTVAWIGIGAWLAAFDYLDFPLARHHYVWKERWAFLRRHAWPALGFGVGVFGLLLIPFLNLCILPIAAVAGTLLYLDLRPK